TLPSSERRRTHHDGQAGGRVDAAADPAVGRRLRPVAVVDERDPPERVAGGPRPLPVRGDDAELRPPEPQRLGVEERRDGGRVVDQEASQAPRLLVGHARLGHEVREVPEEEPASPAPGA
ncbi:hypothetical protein THAOC_08443, partial [Thalassiosira oceanica]